MYKRKNDERYVGNKAKSYLSLNSTCCSECGKFYKKPATLEKHKIDCHNLVACEFCSERFPSVKLRIHREIHLDLFYRCYVCRDVLDFETKSKAETHYKKFHGRNIKVVQLIRENGVEKVYDRATYVAPAIVNVESDSEPIAIDCPQEKSPPAMPKLTSGGEDIQIKPENGSASKGPLSPHCSSTNETSRWSAKFPSSSFARSISFFKSVSAEQAAAKITSTSMADVLQAALQAEPQKLAPFQNPLVLSKYISRYSKENSSPTFVSPSTDDEIATDDSPTTHDNFLEEKNKILTVELDASQSRLPLSVLNLTAKKLKEVRKIDQATSNLKRETCCKENASGGAAVPTASLSTINALFNSKNAERRLSQNSVEEVIQLPTKIAKIEFHVDKVDFKSREIYVCPKCSGICLTPLCMSRHMMQSHGDLRGRRFICCCDTCKKLYIRKKVVLVNLGEKTFF